MARAVCKLSPKRKVRKDLIPIRRRTPAATFTPIFKRADRFSANLRSDPIRPNGFNHGASNGASANAPILSSPSSFFPLSRPNIRVVVQRKQRYAFDRRIIERGETSVCDIRSISRDRENLRQVNTLEEEHLFFEFVYCTRRLFP